MVITMTKMTITDRINAISLDTLTQTDFDFLVDRARKSVHKAGKRSQKPTKKQVENEGFKAQILNILADNDGLTATQVGEHFGWSGSQKAAALLNQLIATNEVVKVKDGKAILFKIAE